MKATIDRATTPTELLIALEGDPRAAASFRIMPPSHQAEYSRYVGEARKAETRQHRAARALTMIHACAHKKIITTATKRRPAVRV